MFIPNFEPSPTEELPPRLDCTIPEPSNLLCWEGSLMIANTSTGDAATWIDSDTHRLTVDIAEKVVPRQAERPTL